MSRGMQLLSLFAILVILSGCAAATPGATPWATEIPLAPLRQLKPLKNCALVYVYRNRSGTGFDKIMVNEKEAGRIYFKEYLMFMTPPGSLVFTNGWGEDKFELKAQSGSTYFVGYFQNEFQLMSEQQGLIDVSSMKSVVSLDQIPLLDAPPKIGPTGSSDQTLDQTELPAPESTP